MTLIKRLFALTLVAVFSLSGLSGGPAVAQEKREGIGISPTQLTLDADPGEKLTGKFIVVNSGNTAVSFRTYVRDFRIRNEQYEKDFEPVKGAISPVDWIKVPTDVRKLQPEGQVELDYTINVPKDAVPRGYYAVIFAETVDAQASATGVERRKRVGSLIYLTVNGGSVQKGKVVSFGAKGWQSQKPVRSELRIQNDGNVHFRATGHVKMRDIFGRTVGQTEIGGTVLPATIRKFEPEVKLNQPFGLYRIEGEVAFLGQTTKLGTQWVWVGSPLWLALWTFIILAWLAVLIRWIKRRAAKRKKA